MSKNKPKTIADLKINWTFEDYFDETISDKEKKFSLQNQELLKFKIKEGDYKFLVNDSSFTVCVYLTLRKFESFIEHINFRMTCRNIELPRKLDRFELVSPNTFRIHLK